MFILISTNILHILVVCLRAIRSRRNHSWVSDKVIKVSFGEELFPASLTEMDLSQMSSNMGRQVIVCSTILHVALVITVEGVMLLNLSA